jgi:CTP synthase (UTP-ammonia lyase)
LIALIGDHDPAVLAHRAIPKALALADPAVRFDWIGTESVGNAGRLKDYAGIWCVPASPYRDTEGALSAIRFARENRIPFLGTCGGFQHALLEYARNVLGLTHASHAELEPAAAEPLIAPLSCSLVEQTGAIRFVPRTNLHRIYGADRATEDYHCRYGLNPRYEALLCDSPLIVSARDDAGEVRAVELDGHPFYVATLFQPERAALQGRRHPVVEAFVIASVGGA